MYKRSYYWVNGITLYRLFAAPVLGALIVFGRMDIFKWMLAISFFTDAIDGYLARRYKVTSIFGSKIDSVADDLTIAAALVAAFIFKPELFRREWVIVIVLLALFLLQMVFALVRYRRLSSFHTYAAKVAAVLQGLFLIALFFFEDPLYLLFYIAALATALDLVEEIILVWVLPGWTTDVKGLYWVWKQKRPP